MSNPYPHAYVADPNPSNGGCAHCTCDKDHSLHKLNMEARMFSGVLYERNETKFLVVPMGHLLVLSLTMNCNGPCDITTEEMVYIINTTGGIKWFRDHMLVWDGETTRTRDDETSMALVIDTREEYVDPDDTDAESEAAYQIPPIDATLSTLQHVKATRERMLQHMLVCNERAGRDNYTADLLARQRRIISACEMGIAELEKRKSSDTFHTNAQEFARLEAKVNESLRQSYNTLDK